MSGWFSLLGLHGLGVNGPSLPTGWFSSGSRTYQLGTVGYGFEQVQFHTVEPVVPTRLTRLVLPHSPSRRRRGRRGRRHRSRPQRSLVPWSPPLAPLSISGTAVAAARVPSELCHRGRRRSRPAPPRLRPAYHQRIKDRVEETRIPWPPPSSSFEREKKIE